VLFYQTQTTKRKVIFPAAYIKVVTESGDIVEYYSENSRSTRKELYKEFIVTRQRALVDFNVEFAVVGKYKDCEEGAGMVPLYKIKDHDFISFKI
jgi:hypothetical protein